MNTLFYSRRLASEILAQVPTEVWAKAEVELTKVRAMGSQSYAIAVESARELAARPMYGIDIKWPRDVLGDKRSPALLEPDDLDKQGVSILLSPWELAEVRRHLLAQGLQFVDTSGI